MKSQTSTYVCELPDPDFECEACGCEYDEWQALAGGHCPGCFKLAPDGSVLFRAPDFPTETGEQE